MSLPIFTRLGLGIGLGLSAATLHPLSPLRTPALQCQYTAPYYRPESVASTETGWAVNANDPLLSKQGRSRAAATDGFMTPSNMKQISLGSVLGLVAGVGLRAFSRVLVVLIGMGVVLVEVCFFGLWFSGAVMHSLLHPALEMAGCVEWLLTVELGSGLRRRGITFSHWTVCKDT